MGILVLLVLLLCSCVNESLPEGGPGGTEIVRVAFDVGVIGSKSSVSPVEDEWDDINVVAYSRGQVADFCYCGRGDEISLNLNARHDYDLYAVAGVGRIEPHVRQEDFLSEFSLAFDSVGDVGDRFPFVWEMRDYSVGDKAQRVRVELERMAAKVLLSVDDSALEGLEIVSVRLCSSPLVVYPFREGGSRAVDVEEVADGDFASESDLLLLNHGFQACFYALENRQGTLLRGNEDPWKKVPDNIREVADLCTYMELTCRFREDNFYSGDMVCRLFLGRDNVGNFDVERNAVLDVKIVLTDEALRKLSWKVEPSVEVSDGYAQGWISEGNHPCGNLYVGERFTYRLSVEEEMSEHLAGDLAGCRIVSRGVSEPGDETEAVVFGEIREIGDRLYECDALCTRPMEGRFVLTDAEGNHLADLDEGVSVKLPYVETAVSGKCIINGSAQTCDVFFLDDCGENLNKDGYETGVFDFSESWSIETDYGIGGCMVVELVDGGVSEDAPVVTYGVRAVNGGRSSRINQAMSDALFSDNAFNLNLREGNFGLEQSVPMELDYAHIKVWLGENRWREYHDCDMVMIVDNPSEIPLNISLTQYSMSGGTFSDSKRNEVLDFVKNELNLVKRNVITEYYYERVKPFSASRTRFVYDRGAMTDNVMADGDRLIYFLDDISPYANSAALLYYYYAHSRMINHIQAEPVGQNTSARINVRDMLCSDTYGNPAVYGSSGWNVMTDYSFSQMFPGLGPDDLADVVTASLQFSYDPETRYLNVTPTSLTRPFTADAELYINVDGYVQTYPNGRWGKAVDNVCSVTQTRGHHGFRFEPGKVVHIDLGELRHAMDLIYVTTFPDSYNMIGAANSYNHSAHPVSASVTIKLKISDPEFSGIADISSTFPASIPFPHHQEGVVYDVPLTCRIETATYIEVGY